MNRSFSFASVAAMALLCVTAHSLWGKDAPRADTAGDAYKITVGDILHISVWKNPDLDRDVPVRPDGKISFPLVDEVDALGRTISELDKLITEKLKKFIRHPDVTVAFKRMAGRKIVVLGEVRNPGVYLIEGRKTILEAIALAGGTTPNAVLDDVLVISGGLKSPRPHKIDLGAALREGDVGDDQLLGNRDVVYVSSVSKTDGRKVSALHVWGEVRIPGAYEIEKTKTVMEAIAMAGGTTSKAIVKTVVVLKGGFNSPKISIVDLRKAMRKKEDRKIVLAARDVVYVPRRPVVDADDFVSQVFGTTAAPKPAPASDKESTKKPGGRER